MTWRAHDRKPRRCRRAGLPIQPWLTAGQAYDGQIIDTLLNHLGPGTIKMADQNLKCRSHPGLVQDQGATQKIPPKTNRAENHASCRHVYQAVNLIERFFSKLTHFRQVATRYDKLAAKLLTTVQLASMQLRLRL